MAAKTGIRWQSYHNGKKDSVLSAIGNFLARNCQGENVALWSKEGDLLGHYVWSYRMHFPLTSSACGKKFRTVVV